MSAPHTPGPWHWKAELGRHEMPMLLGSDGLPVCDFGNSTAYYPIEGTPPEEADARLIAAAPEQHEALEPFATAARRISPHLPDTTEITLSIGEREIYRVSLGSLRAALRARGETL